MIRPKLCVDALEDRTTPVSFGFTSELPMMNVSIPPQDPMDNPPPLQPGTGGNTGGPVSPPTPTPTPTPTPPTPTPTPFTVFVTK